MNRFHATRRVFLRHLAAATAVGPSGCALRRDMGQTAHFSFAPATTEVTARSAVVWLRTGHPTAVQVIYGTAPDGLPPICRSISSPPVLCRMPIKCKRLDQTQDNGQCRQYPASAAGGTYPALTSALSKQYTAQHDSKPPLHVHLPRRGAMGKVLLIL